MNIGGKSGEIAIREYDAGDAHATLGVFLAAVTETSAQDYYSPEQVAAWARPGQRDVIEWGASRAAQNTYVAVVGGNVVGFSDVSTSGHINMLFVSPRYGRRGVGRTLLSFVECRARSMAANRLTANVSITARPLFAAHGFIVEAEQFPLSDGVGMTNFRMVKAL